MTLTRSRPGRRGCSTAGAAGSEAGSVTVEAALVLAVLMVVVAASLAGIGCVIAQLRCADAAREAARLAGRGDTGGAASAVRSIAPAGAVLTLRTDGGLSIATVSVGAVSGLLPGVVIRATAGAADEGRTADG